MSSTHSISPTWQTITAHSYSPCMLSYLNKQTFLYARWVKKGLVNCTKQDPRLIWLRNWLFFQADRCSTSQFIQGSARPKPRSSHKIFTFCLFRRIQFFQSRSLICLRKLMLLYQLSLVNLQQRTHQHFFSHHFKLRKITVFCSYFKTMLS